MNETTTTTETYTAQALRRDVARVVELIELAGAKRRWSSWPARPAPTWEEILSDVVALRQKFTQIVDSLERVGALTPAEARAKLELVAEFDDG